MSDRAEGILVEMWFTIAILSVTVLAGHLAFLASAFSDTGSVSLTAVLSLDSREVTGCSRSR